MINVMNMSYLEVAILKNDSLYERFDEKKLFSREYTHEELIEIVEKWIIDECE